jgi:hypothetical protein
MMTKRSILTKTEASELLFNCQQQIDIEAIFRRPYQPVNPFFGGLIK